MRQVFGSFATGLYLPTSDMDLVVTDSECADVRQGLRALAQALARKGMAKNVQVRLQTILSFPVLRLSAVTEALSHAGQLTVV